MFGVLRRNLVLARLARLREKASPEHPLEATAAMSQGASVGHIR